MNIYKYIYIYIYVCVCVLESRINIFYEKNNPPSSNYLTAAIGRMFLTSSIAESKVSL